MEPSGGQAAHRSHQAVPADPGVRTEGAGGANEFFRVAPLEVRLSCSESEAAKEALEADDQVAELIAHPKSKLVKNLRNAHNAQLASAMMRGSFG